MPAKGLTRPITRKQARSYELSSPNARARRNPLGVTAIAAVMNGRGSGEYARRYAQTKEILGRSGGKGMLQANRRRRRYRPNLTAREYEALHEQQMAAARAAKAQAQAVKAADKAEALAKKAGAGGKKRRSPAQRAATRKMRTAAARKRVGKKYGPFKSVKAKIGGKTRSTYAYMRKGKPRKIPLWAILGAKSKKDLERRAGDKKFARRIVATKRRRERAAQRLMLKGDMFTPNRRRRRTRTNARTIPYRTWSETMNENPRKRRRRRTRRNPAAAKATPNKRSKASYRAAGKKAAATKRRKARYGHRTRTAAQRRATAKMLAKRWGKRVHPRRAWKNPRRKAAKSRRKLRGAALASWLKARGRKPRYKNNARRYEENRRRRRRTRRHYAENRRKTTHRRRRHYAANFMYNENRRRPRRRKTTHRRRRYTANFMYNENRRRRSHRRRGYRRNPEFVGQLKTAFKTGAVIALGFFGHRVLSNLLTNKGLSQITALQSGAIANWQPVIGGALVALVGIPLAAKFAPTEAAKIGSGMIVSFLHQTLMTAFKVFNQPDIAGYFGAYPDASGVAFHSMRGYGSYELMPPGYSGMGAYELMPPGYSGLGQPPHVLHPMAGFGQPITQAAAGYGAITQAAAGYGAITQAAAGMGEYVAQGVQGIGEYEATSGYGSLSGYGAVHEGIPGGNTYAAERALTVAEAAAGIGDLPLVSTVNPDMIAAPIMDAPGGSRAGVFQGGDGIFG